jgi:hypothetical protein
MALLSTRKVKKKSAQEKATKKVTKKVKKRVTKKVTKKLTEKVTEKVTEKITEKITEKVTEKVTKQKVMKQKVTKKKVTKKKVTKKKVTKKKVTNTTTKFVRAKEMSRTLKKEKEAEREAKQQRVLQNLLMELAKKKKAMATLSLHFDLRFEEDSLRFDLERVGTSIRTFVKKAENQLTIEASRLVFFGAPWKSRNPLDHIAFGHAKTTSFVEVLLRTSMNDLKQICKENGLKIFLEESESGTWNIGLIQPINQRNCSGYVVDDIVTQAVARHSDCYCALKKIGVCQEVPIVSSILISALKTGLVKVAKLLDDSHRRMAFHDLQLMDFISSTKDCSVCLCEMNDNKTTSILPCSHIFHTACIWNVLDVNEDIEHFMCPTCRSVTLPDEISPMTIELADAVKMWESDVAEMLDLEKLVKVVPGNNKKRIPCECQLLVRAALV